MMAERDVLIDFCAWLETKRGLDVHGSWYLTVDAFLVKYAGGTQDPGAAVSTDPLVRITEMLSELDPRERHKVVVAALSALHDPEPIRHVRNGAGGVVENPAWWAWEQRQLEVAHLAQTGGAC